MLKYRRWVIAMVLMAFTMLLATTAEAQLRMPFKKRTSTASTTQNLQLTQADGPWLVMCASFTGERGVQQAIQLVSELRNDHGLEAYVYRHSFDHSQKVQGSGWTIPEDKMSLPVQKQWRASTDDSFDEIAVVVGDFAALEDHKAQAALKKIRTLVPRSMNNSEYVGSSQSIEQQHRAYGKGPLGAAFLMPNPMLPAEFFKTRDVDKVVQKMNKGVKYSLLKCPGQYSVRVASFGGDRKFNATSADIQKARRESESRKRSGSAVTDSALVDAYYKANVLCRALRKKGVEAYEFHDRHESYVCVGSFDWATQPVEGGPDQLNPEMADVINQYKATTQRTHQGSRIVPRTIAAFKEFDINFEAQPMPVVVPKITVRSGRRIGGLLGR